ncbi:MAG TPA: ABC transporter substrate-binding protein [Candidatus Enterenecus avicola]|nr:ABC transporter substrate-binding protein [Candidatus Enterenecus avicola]
MKRKTWMAALMAAALSVGLMGCTAANQTQATPQVTTSQEEVQGEEVRLAVISGPTGIGAAKLLTDSDRGETVNHYTYTIASDNNEVVSGLTSQEGEFDIAMVASNMAANLYNKTDGDVRILALGTQGVLHILEGSGGTAIQSMADLKGKTIYATGQGANPEYILRHLLTENGLDPDKDVEIVFADPTEISAKLLSGEIDTAMLPVPAATAAIAKSQGSVRDAIDLTQAWNDLDNGSQLIMSAVVARADFIEEHPQAVQTFLREYEGSVTYVRDNPELAGELVAQLGIAPSATIAQQAIPQCNLVFLSGADMKPAISGYFEVLYDIDPTAVGGALPDDGIYYVP